MWTKHGIHVEEIKHGVRIRNIETWWYKNTVIPRTYGQAGFYPEGQAPRGLPVIVITRFLVEVFRGNRNRKGLCFRRRPSVVNL